ncbi:MAG TPA: AAA family ATPase [Methanobacteriaceae archaeon]|nr:AAA family ATPase [Methanobacteriaceae archaeon]
MHLWNRAAVVGVPGVGKTSLSQAACHELGYHYVNYGELMLEIAQKRSLATNLEELLQLNPQLQFQIWKSAALQVKNVKNMLFDLHGVDLTREGYLISLPFEVIPPEIIIVIEASYHHLLDRRTADSLKNRAVERYNQIKEHESFLKYSIASIAAFLGSNIVFIKNDDFKNSLEDLKDVLKK